MMGRPHVVKTAGASMMPFIIPGSRLIVEREDVSHLAVGDVICYIDEDGQGVAHRVILIDKNGERNCYYVRGDAERHAEEVPADAIAFVVRKVEHRYFAYTTDSVVGRMVVRTALSSSRPSRLFKAGLQILIQMLVQLKKRKNRNNSGLT